MRYLFVLFLASSTLIAQPDAQQESLAEHFHAGQRAAAAQRFDEAIHEFQAVLKIDPNLLQARANLGLMYYSKGDYGAAAAQMTQVVRVQPELLPAQLFLGLSDLNMAKPRDAETALRKALKIDPTNGEAELGLLTACVQQAEFAEAETELQKLKQKPPQEETLYAIGQAYLDLGKTLTSRMAQAYPSSAWAHRLAGDLAAERQDWPAAVVSYRAALPSSPQMPGLRDALAQAAQKAGGANEAAAALPTQTAASALDLPEERLTGGIAAFGAMNYDAAARDFENAMEIRQTPEVLYWLIRTYSAEGGECFEKLQQSFPDSGRAHELRGSIYRLQQNFPSALNEFEQALQKRPDDPQLYRSAGEMWVLLDRPRDADAALKKAAQLSPGSAENEYLLGQVSLRDKDTAGEVAHLKRALALNPALPEVRALLGTAYMHLNQPALAVPQLEKALAIDYHGDLHFQLYKAYRMEGNTGAADKALARSKELRKLSLQSAVSKISPDSGVLAADSADANQ